MDDHMEIIDSHTHWGPSVTLGTNVTTEELFRQSQQSGVSGIVIFPFPSMALSDESIIRSCWMKPKGSGILFHIFISLKR